MSDSSANAPVTFDLSVPDGDQPNGPIAQPKIVCLSNLDAIKSLAASSGSNTVELEQLHVQLLSDVPCSLAVIHSAGGAPALHVPYSSLAKAIEGSPSQVLAILPATMAGQRGQYAVDFKWNKSSGKSLRIQLSNGDVAAQDVIIAILYSQSSATLRDTYASQHGGEVGSKTHAGLLQVTFAARPAQHVSLSAARFGRPMPLKSQAAKKKVAKKSASAKAKLAKQAKAAAEIPRKPAAKACGRIAAKSAGALTKKAAVSRRKKFAAGGSMVL